MALVTTYGHGWLIMRRTSRGDWSPLTFTVAPTRKDSIKAMDTLMGKGFYNLRRRRKEMKAVPCGIEAITRPYLNGLI